MPRRSALARRRAGTASPSHAKAGCSGPGFPFLVPIDQKLRSPPRPGGSELRPVQPLLRIQTTSSIFLRASRLLRSFSMAGDKRFVYVLKNPDHIPRFYVGLTSDLRGRLHDHNAGQQIRSDDRHAGRGGLDCLAGAAITRHRHPRLLDLRVAHAKSRRHRCAGAGHGRCGLHRDQRRARRARRAGEARTEGHDPHARSCSRSGSASRRGTRRSSTNTRSTGSTVRRAPGPHSPVRRPSASRT